MEKQSSMCANQIMNHQTRNLASTSYDSAAEYEEGSSVELGQEHVHEAITNLNDMFTMVGLTEDMPATAKIVGHVFPWLAENLSNADDDASSSTCPMPRKNTSPSNNQCGPGHTHLELPDHPDEGTTRLIEEHNKLDLQVYEAALQQFELQKLALGLS